MGTATKTTQMMSEPLEVTNQCSENNHEQKINLDISQSKQHGGLLGPTRDYNNILHSKPDRCRQQKALGILLTTE
jgi:hypothetical protein